MFSVKSLGASLVLVGIVAAVQLHQPRATSVDPLFPATGWTPKPTSEPNSPLELFRRQDNPALCGYLEGDLDYPLSCNPGWICTYVNNYPWFGCCTGTSIMECDVYTACVNSKSIDDCLSNSECYKDPMVTVCDQAYAPSCLLLSTIVEGNAYGHYVCASEKTSYEIRFPSSGEDESTFELETETDIASSTRFTFSRSTPALTSEDGSSSNTENPSSHTENVINITKLASVSSGAASPNTTREAPTFVQSGVVSTTSSTAQAERTAKVALRIVGVAGIFGLLV